MNLTKEIQKELVKIGSDIELAKTIENSYPANYAFFKPTKERSFRIEYGVVKSEFSLILYERTINRNYEICYLRGIFDSKAKLANVLQKWVSDELDYKLISNLNTELD